jgi:membrane-bound lytic murein transglycosylase B
MNLNNLFLKNIANSPPKPFSGFSVFRGQNLSPLHTVAPLLLACSLLNACAAPLEPDDAVHTFIQKMVDVHYFNETELEALFSDLMLNDSILKKMQAPAEAMPWYRYRKIFITDKRINEGLAFWQANAQTLADAQQRYGVPAEIIVAIIGVETSYGQNTGKHKVLDALYTLAFGYPKRSAFFLGELEQFLLLCREEKVNPAELTGSYAGAMGMPQFMPSSFRNFAVDFDQDGKRDIWHKTNDVIGSVGNYFKQHGWQTGQGIALPVSTTGEKNKVIFNNSLKPDLRLAELEWHNLKISVPLALDTKVKILAFEQEQGEELWAGLDNFYCLTRYNHSPLYAMAVYQLSQAIVTKRVLNEKGAFP